MGVKLSVDIEVVVGICPACGTVYGHAVGFDVQRRQLHDKFYCPNGHGLSYAAPVPVPPPVPAAVSDDDPFDELSDLDLPADKPPPSKPPGFWNFRNNGFGGHGTNSEN
jgi:hypothetical protein